MELLWEPCWVPTAPALLWGSVTQGAEMPGTKSSPKAAEGESWGPVEEGVALEGAAQGGQPAGPTWLTPPESLVHITSFLASPTVLPWKSTPLWG